ncbi:sodium- and chloride-dependent glycine transporter 1-like [Oppia nitens]|uniref:sodium- and chloride-dependent glycine transporter 1-like n=1 Tax=Oppia nitens TaxID=1686743 RepID=UPI0023DB7632|nr:sodium- and chloride-dependent glycine transporter 1-like [Oppia nitens]
MTTRDGNVANDKTNNKSVNKQENRDQWGGQTEFLLACLGNAVGLGNCWRFPYFCYKNGGGAFLIPYIICSFIIGLPLFLIELSLGQYSSMGPAHLYANLSPLFKGLGMTSIISSTIVAVYYNLIISWTLFYFVGSFFGQNWQHCGHDFNSENCKTINDKNNFTNHSVSSTEEYFNNFVLIKSDGLEVMDKMNWRLVGALLVSWIIVVAALIKGIKSSGKVVYFTATFPYVILVILFIRGITLDGAIDGLRYFVTPDWTRVKDPVVWRDAAVQVFYSFGIGGGGMITYASYNRFNDPVVRHSLLVGIGDFLTSIFCGSVVFAMIGYMAHTLNKPVDDIVQSGTGLAFIVIPEGLSQMPLSMVWSMMFFAMLFLLGIDSQFAMVETVTTYIFDLMRNSKQKLNKPLIVSISGVLWFICGLPFCTNAGIYLLTLMDTYAAGIPCLVVGLLEIFIVTYIYGISNFFADLRYMTGWKPSTLMRSHIVVMISTGAPIVISIILFKDVYSLLFDTETITYGKYVYPSWAQWLGWGVVIISLVSIPFGAVLHIINVFLSKDIKHNLKICLRPTKLWRQNAEIHSALTVNYNVHNKPNDYYVNSSAPTLNIRSEIGVINPAFIS